MKVPNWHECEAAVEAGTATALERFVYEEEPCGPHEESFREGLQAVLDELAPKEAH